VLSLCSRRHGYRIEDLLPSGGADADGWISQAMLTEGDGWDVRLSTPFASGPQPLTFDSRRKDGLKGSTSLGPARQLFNAQCPIEFQPYQIAYLPFHASGHGPKVAVDPVRTKTGS
jgi:hypothetical protein